ncbi:protein-glutamate O-methyltransferase CheR [Pigmentiphaga sp. GD03639]|jgi:chemotaxis protein methyltransferase CheR|uniref:Chemotaxis protein CheR n=1 Tax=Pigmentiphaga daeguensis TaxID=414049 RepID=A0ABN1C7I5_9BURK|nr:MULTISPECIES: CheR family methyltransferase [unclassified Pigmentiphaga]MDH2236632.1 protein-glutamate O-methyltransferase CheR [Pigmentiphaga sp. GD03639]OVZ61882.1 chemotaxis protein CheR [Pigmentiphaga sp. NML030171]
MPTDKDFDLELGLLLEAIYLKYQYDFRDYSPTSLRRRIAQALPAFDCRTLSQLQDRILHEPEAFPRLMQYLTIQVSEMFRDPGYFRALREHVVPVLRTYPSIKIWVAGCSTGEELWSLAILMEEEGLGDRTLFYATDIHQQALRAAEAAIYPTERIGEFSRNYLASGGKRSLSDYYHAAYGAASFARSLKPQVVFANHSLATDSVFSEVHLVSCRNVLIYFNRTLQDRALGLFRDALVRRGFLGLGSKENIRFTAASEAFEDFVPAEKIYRKQ